MLSSKNQLIEAETLDIPTIVVFRDRQSFETMHWEQAIIPLKFRLLEVLYILGLKECIFSINMALVVNRANVIMENYQCWVIKKRKVALRTTKLGGVFWMMTATSSKEPRQREGEVINYHYWCRYRNLMTILLVSKTKILPPIKE